MKSKMFLLHLLFFVIILGLVIVLYILLIINLNNISYKNRIIFGIIVLIIFCLSNSSLVLNYFYIKKKREDIENSFDYYIENEISKTGVGAIIFNKNDEIIWVSQFINNCFGKNIIGKKINDISENFVKSFTKNGEKFRFNYNQFIFDVILNIKSRLIILKDVTNEELIFKKYVLEKLVIGELEIDNFQQLQVTLSEEEIFSTQNKIIQVLDKLSEKWNFIYRQYVNGKFVFFTNKEILDELIENKFNFIKDIRKKKIDNEYLSVSIGIGYGTIDQKQLQELAREGLKQAHARGGNQISLMHANKKPVYYGSQFEISQSMSKVKIGKIAKLFEYNLQNPKIKNVIIYGHKLADLDALGAAIGLKKICDSFNKPTYIGNTTFDTTAKNVIKNNYSSKDFSEIFIKKSQAINLTSKNTMIIIVDTSEIERVENSKAFFNVEAKNIFIFDHHRIKVHPKNVINQNIYIDSNASSTSEIIVELISFISKRIKLDHLTSQMLLNGIFLDTSMFTKSVSARTYEAASFLEKQGADSSISSNIMKISKEAALHVKQMLNNIQEIKPGYFLASYDGVVPDNYISMAADEILRIKGRKASFVIARTLQNKKIFKMSARGVNTNVQKIAEHVGGGGHFNSAAALTNEPLAEFIDNLKQAIVSEK